MTFVFFRRMTLVATLLAAALPTIVSAQTSTQAPSTSSATERKFINPVTGEPETLEERLKRFGITEDPGPDPDPKKKWERQGHTFVIEKYPVKGAAFDQKKGWVRPLGYVNIPREIYQQNDEFVWVWMPLVDPTYKPKLAPPQAKKLEYTPEAIGYIKQAASELVELPVQRSSKAVTFRESSDGLPQTGSWRNSLAVADMNEDGNVDLIVPPPRGSAMSTPLIYLGDGKGKWSLWQAAVFPYATNYGSVAAADLNGDGHQDLVFGIHLSGVQAVVGDGKGHFADASRGLASNDWATRRAIIADFNNDKKLDIAAITEGPTIADRDNPRPIAKPRLRVFLNDGKANWKEQPVADAVRELGGDWLVASDLDGNGWNDLAGSSNVFGGTDTIWMNNGKKWTPFGRGWLPFYSYYGAMTAGHFTDKKKNDLIVGFNRYWTNLPGTGLPTPAIKEIAGLDRISWGKNGPTRTPIVRWASPAGIWAMGSADFDGDGNLDVVYYNAPQREYVFLLNDGKGNFSQARLEGIEGLPNTIYDIKVADVNADSKPDVIVMYEKGEQSGEGSVRVYLNETSQKKGAK